MSTEISFSYRANCTSSILTAFEFVMEDENYIEVDEFACIPLSIIQKTTKTGVLHSLSLLSCLGASQVRPAAEAVACGSYAAIAVLLSRPNRIYVKAHFQKQGKTNIKIEGKIKKHKALV